ncbi:sensor domain-containing diguanylate cyclase [Microbulbifer donghaiensis]|nr:diguanylate cyclase [Microbulbifer donghaiensis]
MALENNNSHHGTAPPLGLLKLCSGLGTACHRVVAAILPVLCLSLFVGGIACAQPLHITEQYGGPLGKHAGFLVERDGPLRLSQAYQAWQNGWFAPGSHPIASFGIGSRPVWMQLALHNDTSESAPRILTLGKTWMDHLHVYLLQDGRVLHAWKSGDAHAATADLVPGMGYRLPLQVPPGHSQIFIRAQTADPFVLSVSLRSARDTAAAARGVQYGYSVLFGFLVALICYNLMLYLGFRSRSYLYYALYLVSFIAMCIAYSGHGFAWWWPLEVGFQRFVILVLMVVYGCCGFLFACCFLKLGEHAPQVRRWVIATCAAALMLMTYFVGRGSQWDAALLAFNFVTFFSVAMVLLGVLSIRHGQREGRYFLGAALCSMLGVAATTLSVRGVIPMSTLTFHGVEFGMMLEATLLSLALARQMRAQKNALLHAQRLSRIDPLTGLPNRRAFREDASGIWGTAVRHGRPLSVIVLDIDHFKSVNDLHGHQFGDQALLAVSELLAGFCRKGDRVARWGGEEFVLLLPETNLVQACQVAERLRRAVANCRLAAGTATIRLSISLGAAQRNSQASLDALLCDADQKLYEAKQQGRNRVAPCGDFDYAV